MSIQHSRSLLGHENVLSEFADIPDQHATQIKRTMRDVAREPQPTDHPKVRPIDAHADLYRLRCGSYRAIFDKHLGRLRVLAVGPRSTIYDRLATAERRHGQR